MKAKALEMPEVQECKVSACAYNRDMGCHAKAITVGDMANPECDTFFEAPSHTQGKMTAGVGACKMASCRHNSDFECQTDAIEVDMAGGSASCSTFQRR